MITTQEEYFEYLNQLQNNNQPQVVILPIDEKIYNIDLNKREIETPEFLSVKTDHHSETIYFSVNRYYEFIDLTDTICLISYINANNIARMYPVPYYDIETLSSQGKIIIPWNIEGTVSEKAGNIQYAIKFYKLTSDGKKYLYNLNTQPTKSKILHGLDIKDGKFDTSYYDIPPSAYEELLAKINGSSGGNNTAVVVLAESLPRASEDYRGRFVLVTEEESDILYFCRKLNGKFSWMKIDSDGEEKGGNVSAILGEAILGMALLGEES